MVCRRGRGQPVVIPVPPCARALVCAYRIRMQGTHLVFCAFNVHAEDDDVMRARNSLNEFDHIHGFHLILLSHGGGRVRKVTGDVAIAEPVAVH